MGTDLEIIDLEPTVESRVPDRLPQVQPSAAGLIAPTDYVPTLAMQPEQAKALIAQLDEIKKAVLRPGVDYGIIDGCDKPSLYQPGAERLLQMFGLGVQVRVAERMSVPRYDGKGEGFGVVVEATVTKTINGHAVTIAEGIGYCGHDEKKWGNTREYQRNGETHSTDPAPFHTLMMMARKRAIVSGARTATGASELFTQDVEDMDPEDLRASSKPKVSTIPFDMRSGTKKGTPLTEAPDEDLDYLAKRKIQDNEWKAKNEAFRDECLAILAERRKAAEAEQPPASPPVDDEVKMDLKSRIDALPDELRAKLRQVLRANSVVWTRLTAEQADATLRVLVALEAEATAAPV